MRNSKILVINVLIVIFCACGQKEEVDKISFSFNGTLLKEQYKNTDAVNLQLLNPEKKAIDSVVYFLNNVKVASGTAQQQHNVPLNKCRLGYQILRALVYEAGSQIEVKDRIEVVASTAPKLLSYELINIFPHDTKAFTEGLEFYRDTLYEGTGQNGQSFIRKYDYKTGKIYQQVDLNPEYFGEGITILKDKVYQLTYKSMVGFIYNAGTLKKEKSFNYDKQIEGWGMTNDQSFIYHSDGTEKIWKMDPNTQKMIDYVNVYTTSGKIKSVNELEYVNGLIYGNIWQKDALAVIDPKNGTVVGIVNLADLRKKVSNSEAEVLNGIAYNPTTKTFFVTGKNWDKLFEIRVSEK